MSLTVRPRPPLGCAAVMESLFRAALQEHQLPVTHQREAVARTLFESGARLSADEVSDRLRELDRAQQQIADEHGFHVLTRQTKLYGLCEICDAESGDAFRTGI